MRLHVLHQQTTRDTVCHACMALRHPTPHVNSMAVVALGKCWLQHGPQQDSHIPKTWGK